MWIERAGQVVGWRFGYVYAVLQARQIMKQFPVWAAWVVGIGLPVLETLRRRNNFNDIPAYVDDFIIGLFLAFAAWSAGRGRWYGNGLLIAGWGGLCGAMYYSVSGQIASKAARDISGLPNSVIVWIKLGLTVLVIVCMGLSILRLRPRSEGAGLKD